MISLRETSVPRLQFSLLLLSLQALVNLHMHWMENMAVVDMENAMGSKKGFTLLKNQSIPFSAGRNMGQCHKVGYNIAAVEGMGTRIGMLVAMKTSLVFRSHCER